MADRKLNEVSQVNDAAYIYAEAADGSQVKIKKSDLLNIVLRSFLRLTSLPSAGSNIIGNYDELDSGYGWYNNTGDGNGIYAPSRTGGVFIRFKLNIDDASITLFIPSIGDTKLWYRFKGGTCKQL